MKVSFRNSIIRKPGLFLPVLICLLGAMVACVNPTYPSGRIYLPESDGWQGSDIKVSLRVIQETADYTGGFGGRYSFRILGQLRNTSDEIRYFNCKTRVSGSAYPNRSPDTSVLSAGAGKDIREEIKAGEGALSVPVMALDFGPGAEKNEFFEAAVENGADCGQCTSPGGKGYPEQKGSGIFLWPGQTHEFTLFCNTWPGLVPRGIQYRDQFSIRINPRVFYTDTDGPLSELEFQRPITIESPELRK